MIPTIKFIAFSILMGVLFSACMHSTVLNVVRPADIDIPSEIVTFSVVQRHEAPKGKRFKKNWEGMVSGERIGLDQRSANFSSTGLILELSKSPRFSIKQVIMNEKFYGTGTMTMAEPLSWEEVEKICAANNTEALIVIEAFDSDINKNITPKEVTRTINGVRVTEKVYESDIRAKVFIGWRIYYPNEKRILDVYNDQITQRGNTSWRTELDANNDQNRVEGLVQQGAQNLGIQYARRISPTRVNLTRYFYGKGSFKLKQAKKSMLSKNYDAAIDLWESEFHSTLKQKVKSRSAFNLAVGYEAKGDYETAVNWAKESMYAGNKKAKVYLTKLQGRLKDEERLKRQMNGNDKD
ncbi:MAG: hypothetical protein CMP61_07190 [Flavobacteriales bacterium]|nr:hypothetical protein [Flavobacteriales bacterium]|tara:strand:- start:6985 stop:8040 length:1056 start_codon:yes stop_codon:yes gene_type:complete